MAERRGSRRRIYSAKVWLAWRGEYLYLAADVTDDRHVQKEARQGHVAQAITWNFTWMPRPRRSRSGTPGDRADYVGFSPGKPATHGQSFNRYSARGRRVHARGRLGRGGAGGGAKNRKGLCARGGHPWVLVARLAKTPDLKPNAGMPLNFEIGISDTDGPESAQEKLMTILTTPWNHVRGRLMAAALAPSDGKAPVVVRGLDLAKRAKWPERKTVDSLPNAGHAEREGGHPRA